MKNKLIFAFILIVVCGIFAAGGEYSPIVTEGNPKFDHEVGFVERHVIGTFVLLFVGGGLLSVLVIVIGILCGLWHLSKNIDNPFTINKYRILRTKEGKYQPQASFGCFWRSFYTWDDKVSKFDNKWEAQKVIDNDIDPQVYLARRASHEQLS
jgi:hypothetical protein